MTADTVLLVTASYDKAPEYVEAALNRRAVPFFRLDTDRFPVEVLASYDPQADLILRDGSNGIFGKQIRSVWYRRNVAPNLPEDLEPGNQEFCTREARAFLEGTLAALPTNRWLSYPQAVWRAERKPYQLSVAAKLGFTLPRTVITNDTAPPRHLAREHKLIAKAVSSGYISDPQGNRAIFTSALTSEDIQVLDGLQMAPVIFQERIEKSCDIRVTVVGDKVFAAAILSQDREASRVDWRATDDPNPEHRRHELPAKLAERCRLLVSQLGLSFGAIDFALKPDGSYVFFEINPNGEWLWLEDRLDLPISDAIAEWLST